MRTVGGLVAIAALGAALVGCSNNSHDTHETGSSSTTRSPAATGGAATDTHSGHGGTPTTSVTGTLASAFTLPGTNPAARDVSFAQLMIPHHEQALEMGQMVGSAQGVSPELQTLAKQISAAQGPEITLMKQWLTAWNATVAGAGHDAHSKMPGMQTDEQLKQLKALSGKAFEKQWVAMMIQHHAGAVAMANDVVTTTTNPEVKKLATEVIASQTAEINQMKQMLAKG